MTTAYHAKYFAYELTKQCAAGSVEKIAASLADAQVDLNPHQIEAALFAFRSPLSKGAMTGFDFKATSGPGYNFRIARHSPRFIGKRAQNLQLSQGFLQAIADLVGVW